MPNAFLPSPLGAIRDDFNNYFCALFKNDITPDEDSELADFVEANFSGYASLPTNSWGVPFFDVDRARMNHPILNFVHNGGGVNNDIYGYYIFTTGMELVLAERNPLAPVTVGPGVTYAVAATYTFRDDH
jgi:hypothetical protein